MWYSGLCTHIYVLNWNLFFFGCFKSQYNWVKYFSSRMYIMLQGWRNLRKAGFCLIFNQEIWKGELEALEGNWSFRHDAWWAQWYSEQISLYMAVSWKFFSFIHRCVCLWNSQLLLIPRVLLWSFGRLSGHLNLKKRNAREVICITTIPDKMLSCAFFCLKAIPLELQALGC